MGDKDNLPELSKGWVWVQLISLCTAIGDVDHKMPKAKEKGIPYVSTKDFLQNGKINFEDAKNISEEDYQRLCRKIYPECGDILLSRYGTVGEVRLIQTDLPFQASYSIAIIKPVLHQVNKFIAAALQSEPVQAQIKKYVRGVAQPDLGLAHIRELTLPFAPLAEQERILSKIEELFSELDAGVELLKKLKVKLKRYRQSVLKAAVEGKLTKDWREVHQGELEPASVLLERILKERRQKWEAQQLAQMKAKGKTPKDDSWKLKYKEPVAPDTSDLPELPEEWVWTSLQMLADVIDPNPSHRMPKYVESGIPFISTENFSNADGLDFSVGKRVSQETLTQQHNRFIIEDGDFALSRIGTIGKTRFLPTNKDYCLSHALVIIKTFSDSINKRFLRKVISSDAIIIQAKRGVQSVGVPDLGMDKIRCFSIPLPPLSEQQILVEEVETIFSVVDELEKVVNQNLKRAERLRQSILKKAFEGKLVSQDSTDEPADKLLERIKAEKTKKEAETKAKKKRKQQKKSQQLDLF